ncbi:hypothetical protein [Candidatus Hodgkinia cicadicola]|uniref:hypothetical protein n=1 Tax=Candidatus Hodgkinia cicadicola TaxID=573658 RepID=UPI001788CC8F
MLTKGRGKRTKEGWVRMNRFDDRMVRPTFGHKTLTEMLGGRILFVDIDSFVLI